MKIVAKRFTINLFLYFIIALSAGFLVYKELTTAHSREINNQEQQAHEATEVYRQQISELTQYISILNSRVKHLSMDNIRLSQTGNKLVEKIEQTTLSAGEKYLEFNKLQAQIAALDESIMQKYDAYIAQQDISNNLKISCKKGDGKSKKCADYHAALEVLDNVSLQLKYMKARRDALQTNVSLYTPQLPEPATTLSQP